MRKPRPLAKLTRPRHRHATLRERVFQLLDIARQAPLVWLSGPPGAGKTTAASTYLMERGLPAVWYQVDAGDSDPASFFYYLRLACPARKDRPPLPLLTPEHIADLTGFSRRFFRQFFDQMAEGMILVLDNFQEAAAPELSSVVRDACAELPEGINVLVISRTQPPPCFAELHVRDQLNEVTWHDVRLTLDEARAMCLARGNGDPRTAQTLHEETGGWAAGITLLLERIDAKSGVALGLPKESRESVFNYFAALILDQAPRDLQRMLLAIAFLPRVTPSIAHAISGVAEAGKLLEGLRRKHLFTDRKSGPEPVYQFHALFHAFLRQTAMDSLPPAAIVRQLRNSGDALARCDDWEAAFELYTEAQAWDKAEACVLSHAPILLSTARSQTLTRWIRCLPENRRHTNPWIDYWGACAQGQTSPAQSIPLFEDLQNRFNALGDHPGQVLSLANLFNACAIDHSDYRTIGRWFDTFVEELAIRGPELSVEDDLTAWGALVSAAFFSRPWHPCIEPGLRRIESLLESAVDSRGALRAATTALVVTSRHGQIGRASRLASIVAELAAQGWRSPAERAWALFQLAHHRFVVADYASSFALFDRTWRFAEQNGLQSVLNASLTHRFMIDFRLRDLTSAEASLRLIRGLPPSPHLYPRALLACYEARYAQLRGDFNRAADIAAANHDVILQVQAGFHEICYGLIHGEILLEAGRLVKARQLIERTRELVEGCELVDCFMPCVLLLSSWLALQESREHDGFRDLRLALQQARTKNAWCQLRFTDTTCSHMLPVALEHDIEADMAAQLIRRFRLKPRAHETENWPWPLRVYALGTFDVHLYGQRLQFERKIPKRALGLLKFLIVHGPREVPDQQIVDSLWPDEEADSGHKALSVTLLRLRRLLGEPDLVLYQGGKIGLDRERCWVDVWQFDKSVSRTLPPESSSIETLSLRRALSHYGGELLPDDFDAPWALQRRGRLRTKYTQGIDYLGRRLEEECRFEEAIAWYAKGLDSDQTVGRFCQGIARCQHQLNPDSGTAAVPYQLNPTE